MGGVQGEWRIWVPATQKKNRIHAPHGTWWWCGTRVRARACWRLVVHVRYNCGGMERYRHGYGMCVNATIPDIESLKHNNNFGTAPIPIMQNHGTWIPVMTFTIFVAGEGPHHMKSSSKSLHSVTEPLFDTPTLELFSRCCKEE